MKLTSCKKHYSDGTHRAIPPEETLKWIEPKKRDAGITRVADITSLDRVGIPVFSSIRPLAGEGSVSVYNGKGATPLEAQVSAIMEGIERYSSEIFERKMRFARYGELLAEETSLNPEDLILPRGIAPGNSTLPWVEGYDIVREEKVFVPAHAVFHPIPREYPPLFRSNTNGLASGNTLEEAVFHALAELIERDAWSLAEVARDMGPIVTGVRDPAAVEMLEKFADAQVSVTVRDLTSDIGVPTIAAAADDTVLKDPGLLTLGMGTHTNPRIALIRALTEVAQSRLTQIHGAREDTTTADLRRKMGYDRMKRMNRRWYEGDEEIKFASLPSCDHDDFLDEIRYLTGRLAERGLGRVIVVDLTRPEVGVPVVRVIVPGLEVYAMDAERVGMRCRDAQRRSLSRSKS